MALGVPLACAEASVGDLSCSNLSCSVVISLAVGRFWLRQVQLLQFCQYLDQMGLN